MSTYLRALFVHSDPELYAGLYTRHHESSLLFYLMIVFEDLYKENEPCDVCVYEVYLYTQATISFRCATE